MSENTTDPSYWDVLKRRVFFPMLESVDDAIDWINPFDGGGESTQVADQPKSAVPMPGYVDDSSDWTYNPNNATLTPPQYGSRPTSVTDEEIANGLQTVPESKPVTRVQDNGMAPQPPLSWTAFENSLREGNKRNFLERTADSISEGFDRATGDFTAKATKPLGPTPLDSATYLVSDAEKSPIDVVRAWQPILRSLAVLHSTYGLREARDAARIYAVSDALTGNFDRFRTPGEKPRVIETLQPYITMFTLGAGSSLTEVLDRDWRG
jgi:hypothetical protein